MVIFLEDYMKMISSGAGLIVGIIAYRVSLVER
jgi:hypothetical protein